ncbi:polymeric immunoglobulin receptor-like isoform X1 [Grus americana]|uniref:polymeric immunoglobulin receptor-like isoform X1 n=1 Tax=Grus americana TaxID=9117 RepID=UPI0024078F01|nr:polymeric immunoglobulin receptor-like isoform X1 [Grus americana]
MELRALLLLPLCFPGHPAQTADAEERQWEGSTLCIQCPYTEHDNYWQQKAWVRVRDDKPEVLVETTNSRQYPYATRATKGKVTIEDKHTYRTVVITMTNLQAEDSGTYSCALLSYNYGYVPLKTISLNVFKGHPAQTPDAEERQWEGSTLCIQCPYTEHDNYWQQKAWVRVRDDKPEVLVKTTNSRQYPYATRATKGKVTIEDNVFCRTVVITMTNLQAEDSGTYSCALLSYNYGYVLLKTISLNVFKVLRRWELDSLSVQCPYSTLGHSTETKVWCRRQGQTECKAMVRTDYPSTLHNSKALEGRTLIQDDTQNRIITITMKKLQAQDSSVYACELYRYPHPTRIMEVKLSVSKRTQQYSAKELGNVSVQCLYNATDYGAVSKAWCKEEDGKPCTILAYTNWSTSRTPQQGRVTMQDNTQQGIVTVTMEKLQAQDSGVYWCALYEHDHLFRMVEVTLNISDALGETTLSGTAGTSSTTLSGNTTALSSNVNTFILISGVLSILFILALISSVTLCVRRRKQLKRRGTRQEEDIYEKPEDIAQLDSTERIESPTDDSKDPKYVTLNFKSRLSSEDPLYCNVERSQAHKKAKDENVEYAVIALKQLPTNDKG